MIAAKWILFLLIGKILIYIWMQFELPSILKKYSWLSKLHDCDLCSGVWIFSTLSLFLETDLLSLLLFEYVPVVSEIVTGIVVSWIVHIFTLGWKSKYDIVVV